MLFENQYPMQSLVDDEDEVQDTELIKGKKWKQSRDICGLQKR